MVQNALWQRIAGIQTRFLCIARLERRLGRRLRPSDFTGAPVNEPNPWDTPLLASRKA
jgi:hypothetical protein